MALLFVAIAAVAPLAAQDPATLLQGLAGYWKLDETAGPAADSSGHGLTGEWQGGISAVDPDNAAIPFNDPYCSVLNGTTDVISVPSNPWLDATGDFTIALWIYPTEDSALDGQTVISKQEGAGRNYMIYRMPG